MPFPFEVPFDELRSDLDKYVDAVFSSLESESLVMPDDDECVELSVLENAIEDVLTRADISHRRTKLAETLDGICQAPDFVIPSESSPQVVIEAKLAEDDGTARDTLTRVQHLAALSMDGQPPGQPRFEVVACIAGRGFGVRRNDMKHLLLATRGRTFTLRNMGDLVSHTLLTKFRSSTDSG